jgi:hypothetical protein
MNLPIDTDDAVLRDLLTRGTDGLSLEPGLGHDIAVRQRRQHLRRQFGSVAVTGVAASVAFVSLQSGSSTPKAPSAAGTPSATASPAIQLTASQKVLFGLADTAADKVAPEGRYAVMSEVQANTGEANIERTSVIDSVTGDNVTYQRGDGAPAQLTSQDGTTAAQYAALPRDPKALAAALVKQADADLAQGKAAVAQLEKQKPVGSGPSPVPIAPDDRTAADKVFEQAAMMLWNPLVQPSLRASLYRVLADTKGVEVIPVVHDSRGRTAILLRHTSTGSYPTTISVYQDQATAQTLETDYENGSPPSVSKDIYLSVTRTDAIPTDPYTR